MKELGRNNGKVWTHLKQNLTLQGFLPAGFEQTRYILHWRWQCSALPGAVRKLTEAYINCSIRSSRYALVDVVVVLTWEDLTWSWRWKGGLSCITTTVWWHHTGTIRKAGRPLQETWTFLTCDPGTGCLVGQSCIAPVPLLLLRRKRYFVDCNCNALSFFLSIFLGKEPFWVSYIKIVQKFPKNWN